MKGNCKHTNTVIAGECYEGCCDRYACLDCGEKFFVEVAQ